MVQQIFAKKMRTFIIILIGQSISIMGSRLTTFALGVWVFLNTGSVTQFSLIAVSATIPGIVIAPFAGTLVDRWDRRKAMIFSDSGAALRTLAIVVLLSTQNLEIWHIYLAAAVNSFFRAFQQPAFHASITLLVPKKNYARANAMVDTMHAVSDIAAPVIAGILIVTIQLWGVLMIDFATFLFALFTLLIITIPKPEATPEGQKGKGSFLQETAYGWKYVRARSGLFALLLFFASLNFSLAFSTILLTPLVLSFGSPPVLGTVESVGSIGMFIGGLFLSTWGGPNRRIPAILGSGVVIGSAIILSGIRPNAVIIATGEFIVCFCIPIVSACSRAIWQAKTAPDVQGRVFSIRSMISWSTTPLSYFSAGVLADSIFEPLMASKGALAPSVGKIIGVGPGRGIGLMFIMVGILAIIAAVVSLLNPRLRYLEDELPDVVAEEPSGHN